MHLHSSAQEHAQPLRLLPRLPFRVAACDDDRRRLVGVETKFLRTAKRRVHHRIPSLRCRSKPNLVLSGWFVFFRTCIRRRATDLDLFALS